MKTYEQRLYEIAEEFAKDRLGYTDQQYQELDEHTKKSTIASCMSNAEVALKHMAEEVAKCYLLVDSGEYQSGAGSYVIDNGFVTNIRTRTSQGLKK